MADGVFNAAKGKVKYYWELPAAADSIIAVLFKSGTEAEGTLNNYADLATLKASNTEADFTNYARKTLTANAPTVDNTNDRCDLAPSANTVWTAAGGATNNVLGKLIICYKPDTASADSAIIPLSYHDFSITTNGTDLTAQYNAAGVIRAA